VSPTHEAQRVPPILAMLLRAPFETRHPSGVNGSVPGTAPRPVVPPRQGDRSCSRSSESLRTRSRATLTVSPDEIGTDTFVIVE
jgi:hypothetical protein